MIANERQYRITRTATREFEEALARLETVEAHRPPEMRRVMREAMESQLEEAARGVSPTTMRCEAARSVFWSSARWRLPDALDPSPDSGRPDAEGARRATRSEGAASSAVRGDAVLPGVSLERIQAVAEALGVQIREQVILPTASRQSPAVGLVWRHTARLTGRWTRPGRSCWGWSPAAPPAPGRPAGCPSRATARCRCQRSGTRTVLSGRTRRSSAPRGVNEVPSCRENSSTPFDWYRSWWL